MTAFEFSKEIDSIIKDFTTGVISEAELKSLITYTAISVAKPNLEFDKSEMPVAQLLQKFFKPSRRNEERSQFYSFSDLSAYLSIYSEDGVNLYQLHCAIKELGYEVGHNRRAYEKVGTKGYWLELI